MRPADQLAAPRSRRPARTPDRGRASTSCTAISSSRKPGWPRFSASSSVYRRAELDAAAAASAARRRAPDPTSRASSGRSRLRDDSGAGTTRHQNAPRMAAAAAIALQPGQHDASPQRPSTSSTQPRQPRRQRLGRERGLARRAGSCRPDPRAPHARPSSARNRSERRSGRAPSTSSGTATIATDSGERSPRSAAAPAATGTAMRDGAGAPESLLVPEPLRAVDGREQRADDADAAAGDDVDLDAGFVKRAQHAGVVGAGRAGSGQDERGATSWRVRFNRGGPASRGRSVIPRLRRGW